MMSSRRTRTGAPLATALLAAIVVHAAPAHAGVTPVDTAFTYQGQLRDANGPINGTASVRFRLYDAELLGAQQGPTLNACDLTLVDGLFTVELDFGTNVFDGSERWLDIGVQSPAGNCLTYTPLAPRQQLLPAPYAIRSLAPWETSGTSIFYNAGDVGIGTDTPDTDLELVRTNAQVRITSTAVNGTSLLELKGDAPSPGGGNELGSIRFLDETNAVRAEMISILGLVGNQMLFELDGTVNLTLGPSGNVGIGTIFPTSKLHIEGGSDSEPGSGGYLVLGATNAQNLSFDNNEIMARNDGAASLLFINNDGGDVSICAAGSGQVGIGTAPTSAQLTVFDSLLVTGGLEPHIHVEADGLFQLDEGGIFYMADGSMQVNTQSSTQAYFNRVTADGTLLGFRNAGVVAGSISVSGSTVIYGTFTGAHNGWTEQTLEPGTLVSLVGEVRRGHEGPNCEPTYGIAATTIANDPRVCGSYIMHPDPKEPASHHLFGAVGNGEMWVVESGLGDIEPGDALISSEVPGAAMKDDPARFAVGHVVARAAEPVQWAGVKPDADGSRRVRLSVFYDRFDRQGDAVALNAALDALRAENAALQQRTDALGAENADLRSRLELIESRLDSMATPTAGGSR